ncbi:hypothetical protein RchiOBHm_Chr4g0437271 [Rosa chinensis]|uniref:Uncharacterized protein n=1 Tax=Rosa chinensis TaxID=74649 RepID=A0A2P6R290_ROSCH|nr:hypothetical protein RchiOBHm_Chr4g0437271 [Rosa chinensis]
MVKKQIDHITLSYILQHHHCKKAFLSQISNTHKSELHITSGSVIGNRSMDTASSHANLISKNIMGKGKEESKGSSVLSPFTWCFFGSDGEGDNARGSKAVTGPEAAMVAAAKHFSSAHKVRFN